MLLIGGRDLGQRALSALVLVPVVLVATYVGGVFFTVLWALAGLAILYEWAALARLEHRRAWLIVSAVGLAGASLAVELAGTRLAFGIILAAAGAAALVVPRQGVLALAGVLVAGAAALPVMVLRGNAELGLLAVVFLYAVVWATDVFAYFSGRLFGGPKLWPKISPNKTWAGAIGGALAGLCAGLSVALLAGLPGAVPLAVLALVMSLASQAGDLAESAIKRAFGVKDTSRLIPGHGGFLDRLDGFIAASLFAILVAVLRDFADPAVGLLLW